MRRSVWPLLLLLFLLTALAACRQETPAPSAADGGSGLGRVHGTIVTPLEGSLLYVYKKGMDLYGPAFALSEATGADGSFDLQLPPGEAAD